MALAGWQSHTFWVHTRHDEPLHEDVFKEYWNFFYATHEAHLTMMIVSLDCLCNTKKPNFHNFETLLSLIEANVDPEVFVAYRGRLKKLQELGKGIQVIRNNSFAHITDKDVRKDAGEKYELDREDYLKLSYNAMKLATEIGLLLGEDVMARSPEDIADKDLSNIHKIYDVLETSTG
jgi:hypothetical protein